MQNNRRDIERKPRRVIHRETSKGKGPTSTRRGKEAEGVDMAGNTIANVAALFAHHLHGIEASHPLEKCIRSAQQGGYWRINLKRSWTVPNTMSYSARGEN